jgi:hypothetical protein
MPVAVEAIPPKPNTAATSAITRNISAQYNIANSLRVFANSFELRMST